jgi:GNAT superfamily N-acetyltransferase
LITYKGLVASVSIDSQIIPFTSEHLEDAVRLSHQVNWPHRIEDWALMLSVSEGVVALCDGQVIGTALTTLYGKDHAASNMIIVDDVYRGRGLGHRLMNEVLTIAAGRENRLTATEIGLPLYSKLGFQITGRISQHQGALRNLVKDDEKCAWDDAPDIERLCELDRFACGMDRHLLMRALMGVGRIAVVRDGGLTCGFAILRNFGRGKVVGPVVCADIETAKSLISFAMCSYTDTFMRIDLPEEAGLYEWLSELGLEHVGEHVRMTLNPHEPVEQNNVKTFALVSQALG